MLKGVSLTRRNRLNPALVTTPRMRAHLGEPAVPGAALQGAPDAGNRVDGFPSRPAAPMEGGHAAWSA
jgi:hypothetical protein